MRSRWCRLRQLDRTLNMCCDLAQETSKTRSVGCSWGLPQSHMSGYEHLQ